mmetsp:Transcript_16547/g.25562  ORF Transcript_16547/g.25562 Transcript_16547/m.25562 type:complete len:290 (-) Transcript_16547:272-1141(-)
MIIRPRIMLILIIFLILFIIILCIGTTTTIHAHLNIKHLRIVILILLFILIRQIRVLSSLTAAAFTAKLILNLITQTSAASHGHQLLLRWWSLILIANRHSDMTASSASAATALIIDEFDLELLHFLLLAPNLFISEIANASNQCAHNDNGSNIRSLRLHRVNESGRRRMIHFLAIVAAPTIIAQAMHISAEGVGGAHPLRRAHRHIIRDIGRIQRIRHTFVGTRKRRRNLYMIRVIITAHMPVCPRLKIILLHKGVEDTLRLVAQLDIRVTIIRTQQRNLKPAIQCAL